jgi:hypothetical protein
MAALPILSPTRIADALRALSPAQGRFVSNWLAKAFVDAVLAWMDHRLAGQSFVMPEVRPAWELRSHLTPEQEAALSAANAKLNNFMGGEGWEKE